MDIKPLRYFLALAKTGSISAAAEYLHLTQPTLSRQLADLEYKLDTQLFVRGSRRITLTEDGEKLRHRAEEILALVAKTEQEFKPSSEAVSGEIYIGCGETVVMRHLIYLLHQFQQDYPQVKVHIISADANDTLEKLNQGLLDFGVLLTEETYLHAYEHLELPEKDSWGALMRKDHPLAAQASISPEDLRSIPLISSRQAGVGDFLGRWLKYDYEELNVVATYNLIFNATLMVQQGIGIALGLDKLAHTGEDSQLTFRPFSPPLEVKSHIVWKKYRSLSKAAALFLNRVKAVLR
ncbi:LysR family transcriptional regulator [Testudinibacter sp. TR-2022]|uniref:LysR family transcriptional regulator n=1 Tax=Testudinibacter sp. TR-2022 TaxID=2585029 RepID=UPI00111A3902|nr:LysR family transcriptional regulator [Testudinibacter sp. TR-2022]TNH06798.1 LysR family transcriptional regulator [Pasteurellaceae bacterium Phil11]TNH24128.1 LysR family transcriptional regulator [Testudinibacter sp. TR-2022]TNH27597.1 LysR family transcriptional regulator [Testudinibacter sp. TR-2022]